MKFEIEKELVKITSKIKETKELLKLFNYGEDYYNHKIKKFKSNQLENLNEEDLKRKLDELTKQQLELKRSKPMLTIYNDGSDQKVSLEDIQLFLLASLKVNLNAAFGLIKNMDKLDRASVFVIEDDRLSKLVLDRLEMNFDHHIQFQCEDTWIQDLLRVNLKKSIIDLKQVDANKNQVSEDQDKIELNNQVIASNQKISQQTNEEHQQNMQQSSEFKSAYLMKRSLVKKQPIKRTDLLLNVRQLIREHYPLPIDLEFDNKIDKMTKSTYKPVTETSPMFGLDCEMCQTEKGDLDVTRISLIDEDFNVLMDELVKPKMKIVNYLTQFSGIRPQDLEGITTTLEDIQQRLNEKLPEDAILVGHSLNCDLQSLKLCHPYIIDTSCIYNFNHLYNTKPSLKQLSKYYLKTDIQNSHGHCPTEDAKAAMELVQLKLSKDITFGDNRLSKQRATRIKATMTLAEFLKLKEQNDVRIVYDYLELEPLKRFISVSSKHMNKIVDKISWSLTLSDSICIVILKGKCMISIN